MEKGNIRNRFQNIIHRWVSTQRRGIGDGSHVQKIEELLDGKEGEVLWDEGVTKMKDLQIDSHLDSKWAKYSMIQGPPKVWFDSFGEEKNFLKDFQSDHLRNSQYLSEYANKIIKGRINKSDTRVDLSPDDYTKMGQVPGQEAQDMGQVGFQEILPFDD